MRVLVTGATGYIGGRLVPRLLEAGYEVRCMTRNPTLLDSMPWRDRVEVVFGDALSHRTLAAPLEGCDTAYYLIHSMAGSRDFVDADRRAAENFRDAAANASLRRIVYLGGLGSPNGHELSEHLASRREVGEVLLSGPVPVTMLRAAVIIGSGSMSFEMVRHLTEILPIMARPAWIQTKCQPIGVRNVLEILIAVIDDPNGGDHVYDIGGPDVLTYEEMMQQYASEAGLPRRIVIPLPLLGKGMSKLFASFATPLPPRMVSPLIDSVSHDVIVTNPSPPGFEPRDLLSYRESVRLALRRVQYDSVETRWSGAPGRPAAPMPHDPTWSGEKMYIDRQSVESTAPIEDIMWAVNRLGGDVGYYAANWAWRIRGWADQAIGGVGLRRGRRDPEHVRLGETIDFFRVVECADDRLTLQVEMKVPGTGWLGWTAIKIPGGTRVIQSARFAPKGLFGRLYWWSMIPFHHVIFRKMLRNICRSGERRMSQTTSRFGWRTYRSAK
jgi:uncharacterized protein YbjT (DUF2867 family)